MSGHRLYVLHDRSAPEPDRVQAAFRLSRDPRVDDTAADGDVPETRPARSGALPAGRGGFDRRWSRMIRGFALAVARSPDWPDWLRLLLARRLAYGAGRGYADPREALDRARRALRPDDRPLGELRPEPCCRIPKPQAVAELEKAAHLTGPAGELATRLLEADSLHRRRSERRAR